MEHGVAWKPALASLAALAACGCEGLRVEDAQRLLVARSTRSELLGFVAGFATTFAAVPDSLAMLRRRSSAGMSARMAAISGGAIPYFRNNERYTAVRGTT